MFELCLFSVDCDLIGAAVRAGVDSIVVDWEAMDKYERQASANTQINRETVEDLRRVRGCTSARVICRLNSFGSHTRGEVEDAIRAGADELLLPMVRSAVEVQALLDYVGGRCRTGILIETLEALADPDPYNALPLSRIFVGLNDIAIQRRTSNIFLPLVDGTLERLKRRIHLPFGFAGLTLPECGSPIPCRLLMGEMIRLDCHFSFLRRSFHRDVRGRDLREVVAGIRTGLETMRNRTEEEIRRDRDELQRTVLAWPA